MKTKVSKSSVREMGKWYRDLERAYNGKKWEVVKSLVEMEENQRRADVWRWSEAGFDAEFIEEKDALLERAVMAVSLTAH